MRTDIGRFFDGRLSSTVETLKVLHDIGLGAGKGVSAWIDGREMLFGLGEEQSGAVFLRVISGETKIMLAFPRGAEIHDPEKRGTMIPPGTRKTVTLRSTADIDVYLRRMISIAYELEADTQAKEAAAKRRKLRARPRPRMQPRGRPGPRGR